MDKIRIGKVVNTVGLRGEIKVYNYAESPERYQNLSQIYVGEELFDIEKVRLQKNTVILKIQGVDSLEQGEKLRGQDVYFSAELLEELPSGSYYIRDLIGISVYDRQGNLLGKLKDVIKGAAQDLYEIDTGGKMVLLPGVSEFVLQVDLESGRIVVDPPKGLMEL
jgi:16S rRNA processing protein RimM